MKNMPNLLNNLLNSPCTGVCLCKKFSTSTQLLKTKKPKAYRPIRYRTPMQEPASSERNQMQRLSNMARGLIPFNKKFPITGKNTGPGVEGGSDRGQKMAALHRVQPTGYTNRFGQYIRVKEMIPDFVVPDLRGFSLKPYVPYKDVVYIKNEKHTAREIFDEHVAESVKQKFYDENKE